MLNVDRASVNNARLDYPFLDDRLDDYSDLECTEVANVVVRRRR